MAKAHKLTRTQVDILRCIAEQPRETSMIDTNSLGCLCRWAEFYTAAAEREAPDAEAH